MKALVLSGGSIKGAFQAGAVNHVLTNGFEPDAIFGTSVGSLNGGFVAERAGRTLTGQKVIWPQIGRDLWNFWSKRIINFGCIGKKRGKLAIVFSLKKRFNGLLDMSPLRKLVYEEFKPENIRKSPANIYVCVVNIANGQAVYADRTYSDILEYIIASTAIPLVMPMTLIGSEPFWDGGIREVAPLKKAIDLGATEIICVACDPKTVGGIAMPGATAPFLSLANRLMEMVINETLNNDINACEDINTYLENCKDASGLLADRKPIKLTVIRPQNTLNIDLETFTKEDIKKMLEIGREVAESEFPKK